MSKIKTSALLVFIFMLASCKYASMSNSEIEQELYNFIPVGTDSGKAIKIAEEHFGQGSFVGKGFAINTDTGWEKKSWSTQEIENEPYFLTYKLGSYPSAYVVIPTTVYGTWFFGKNNQLVNVAVKRETDGI